MDILWVASCRKATEIVIAIVIRLTGKAKARIRKVRELRVEKRKSRDIQKAARKSD